MNNENLEYFLLNREQLYWEEKNNKKMLKKQLGLDWEYTRKQLKKSHKKRNKINGKFNL